VIKALTSSQKQPGLPRGTPGKLTTAQRHAIEADHRKYPLIAADYGISPNRVCQIKASHTQAPEVPQQPAKHLPARHYRPSW
jgi:hypothetical protein